MKLRPMQTNDFGFILNSWLKSYRNSKFAKNLTNERYYRNQSEAIFSLLAASQVVVMVDDEDTNHIYGYAVGHDAPDSDGYWLHYMYVKHLYRRLGVATNLIQHLAGPKEVFVTHWRPVCAKLGWKKITL